MTNIRVGNSVTVKFGEINEKIREGKTRSMRKELVGLYYLAHIALPYLPFIIFGD